MLRRAFYPYLFIAYVILTPLSVNLDQLDPAQALRPSAVILVLAAAGMLLLYSLTRDWQYTAYLVFLSILFFFLFGHLIRLIQERTAFLDEPDARLLALGAWTVLFILLATKLVWSRLGLQFWLVPFLNLLFAIALVGPAFSILAQALPEIGAQKVAASTPTPASANLQLDCASSPDIYYIIVDGYGRADVLSDLYDIDNLPFVEYLEGKGFYVAGESHANYTQTIFSIASALNFSYIDPPSGLQNDALYFRKRIAGSTLLALLKGCNYQIISNHSGFYFTNELVPGAVLTPSSDLTEFESLILSNSPYEILASRLFHAPDPESYAAHRQRAQDSLTALREAYRLPGPKLVFVHIISPHPPFVFDEKGRALEPEHPYSMNDGDEYPGTVEEYRLGYAGQVSYVNRQLQQVVDTLLARSDTPPVIIIQGDHGPGLTLDWSSPYNTCLRERASILNAYYLPGIEPNLLYPSISPVNTFRVVLNEYFGTDLPLLPDESFFTSHRIRRQALNVTSLRESGENCTISNN